MTTALNLPEAKHTSPTSLRNYNPLYCACGQPFALDKSVESHFSECTHFKSRFGELLTALINTAKNVRNRNDYNMVKYLFHLQKYQIRSKLKSTREIPEFNPNPSHMHDPAPGCYEEEKEVKLVRRSEFQLAPQLEPAPEMPSPLRGSMVFDPQIILITCLECNRQFPELNNTVYLSCMHSYCLDCMKNKAFREIPESGQILCKCKKPITDSEIQAIIGPESFEKLQKQYLKRVAENSGLIICTCGNMFELVAGKADPNQRDEKGKKLSKEAAGHMGKYRVRCNACEKNFCSKCMEYPYHLGYTCESYKFYKSSAKCRYCKAEISKKGKKPGDRIPEVCKNKECIKIYKTACNKILPCEHHCCGYFGEPNCLPCLSPECVKKDPNKTFSQTEDSYCPICYTSGLGDLPSIMLGCGHIMHVQCLMEKLKKRWPGPRITFFFAECPSCRKLIEVKGHIELEKELRDIYTMLNLVKEKALQRLKFEGIEENEKKRLNDPSDRYYNKPEELAMAKLSYYLCYKCHVPYFGGLKSCENDNNEGQQNYKPSELICAKCAATGVGAGIKSCRIHGTDYIEYKCKFCCSVAQWFCWGTTHFCNSCHTRQARGDYVSKYPLSKLPKCTNPALCPLKVVHPSNGTEFALGCAICRNQMENYKGF